MSTADPYAVLGLAPGATVADVRAARRRLATVHHPDRGGDPEQMQRINAAAERLIVLLTAAGPAGTHPSSGTAATAGPPPPPSPPASPPQRPRRADAARPPGRSGRRRIDHDEPSFTLDVAPPVAFDALLRAVASLGAVTEADPPHHLGCRLDVPVRCWCGLDLLPAPGPATTVSLTVVHDAATPTSAEEIRDVWVAALNRLGGQPL